jgi:hypothetical protein
MPTNTSSPQRLEPVQSEKFTSIYSNTTNLEVTPWDFKFIFGRLVKPAEGNVPKIENLTEVIMSPQHAKALFALLNNHIQEYEKQVGEIKLPQPENLATKS